MPTDKWVNRRNQAASQYTCQLYSFPVFIIATHFSYTTYKANKVGNNSAIRSGLRS